MQRILFVVLNVKNAEIEKSRHGKRRPPDVEQISRAACMRGVDTDEGGAEGVR